MLYHHTNFYKINKFKYGKGIHIKRMHENLD